MSNEEIKPCPFCGCEKLSIISMDEDDEYWCIWCSKCKATGPIVAFPDETELLNALLYKDDLSVKKAMKRVAKPWNARRDQKGDDK
jgi:Lar family restriction alleviation protein